MLDLKPLRLNVRGNQRIENVVSQTVGCLYDIVLLVCNRYIFQAPLAHNSVHNEALDMAFLLAKSDQADGGELTYGYSQKIWST